jgi:hypothetical protein
MSVYLTCVRMGVIRVLPIQSTPVHLIIALLIVAIVVIIARLMGAATAVVLTDASHVIPVGQAIVVTNARMGAIHTVAAPRCRLIAMDALRLAIRVHALPTTVIAAMPVRPTTHALIARLHITITRATWTSITMIRTDVPYIHVTKTLPTTAIVAIHASHLIVIPTLARMLIHHSHPHSMYQHIRPRLLFSNTNSTNSIQTYQDCTDMLAQCPLKLHYIHLRIMHNGEARSPLEPTAPSLHTLQRY